MTAFARSPVVAVLGPTNTGKTHLAIERMCGHASGMIGFPLRLLAREVYDRVCAIKGVDQVALVTGEEKIVPPRARYFLCTAESMLWDRDFAFVAIDEAQLGIDAERGHIFTDRMLNARGREETMILGSESLTPLVSALLPDAQILTRPRFSTLSYAGPRKLSRLPRRSAIVAFSVEDVYAIAEMIRRDQGGAAIVMGSLSPATRNAQVAMYQAGEVDYLVATDAIGMGLNLDVHHVAFASLTKFDGRRKRRLTLAEIGQIAGRAGRHQRDGSFGMVQGLSAQNTLDEEEIERLENHAYPPLEWLYWRQPEPDCASVDALIASLSEKPDSPLLEAAPEAIDLAVLKWLAERPDMAATQAVALLWEAASIPDFRKVGPDHQARFVASLWPFLSQGNGRIPRARVAQEIARLDDVRGDIATLAGRIAAARSWSYIAHKPHWVEDSETLVARARELEQRLSDAMHMQLTQRFVDKRTRILRRGLEDSAVMAVPAVDPDGTIFVDGVELGRLNGFQFRIASDSRRDDRKMLLAVAERYLGGLMTQLADELANAPDAELSLGADESGRPTIFWKDATLAYLAAGKDLLFPEVKLVRSVRDLAPENMGKVRMRVENWLGAMREKHLGGLIAMQKVGEDPATPATVRAVLAQLAAEGGIIARYRINRDINALTPDERGIARKAGLVYAALDIYHHQMMKPGAVLWRAALFAVRDDEAMPPLPPENAVHLAEWPGVRTEQAYRLGFRRFGEEYVRLDMVNKLVKQAHDARGAQAVFAIDEALATSLGLSVETHGKLLESAGFAKAEAPPPEVAEAVVTDSADSEAVEAASAEPAADSETPATPADPPPPVEDAAAPAADAALQEQVAEPAAAVAPVASEAAQSWWRWQGMRKARPDGKGGQQRQGFKQKGKKRPPKAGGPGHSGKAPAKRRADPPPANNAFAELAALRDKLKS